jgi:hypothetical protein
MQLRDVKCMGGLLKMGFRLDTKYCVGTTMPKRN